MSARSAASGAIYQPPRTCRTGYGDGCPAKGLCGLPVWMYVASPFFRSASQPKAAGPKMLDALCGADQHHCTRRMTDDMHGPPAGVADTLECVMGE